MVFCGKCGTKNPDDNLYCRQCGARISQSIPTESEPVPEPEPKRTEKPVETRVIEVSDDADEKPLSSMTPAERRRLSSKTDADPPGTGADKAMMVIGGLLTTVAVAYLLFVKTVDVELLVGGVTLHSEPYTVWEMVMGSATPSLTAMFIIAVMGMVMSLVSSVFSVFGLVGTIGCFAIINEGFSMELGYGLGEIAIATSNGMAAVLISAIFCLTATGLSLWGYYALGKASGRWDPVSLMWRSIL